MHAEPCALPERMIARAVGERLVRAVLACPDGVRRMSMSMPGLVQTSSNLARVVSDGRTVRLQSLLRSSVNSEKEELGQAFEALFTLAGARVELTGSYDGWKPDMDSPILKAMTASYEALYGRKPLVTAIHAGLECGIIGGKYPGLDMISFGPTICYPHSPDEKADIASALWKPTRSNGSSLSIPWPEAAAGLTIFRRYRSICAMRTSAANRSSPSTSSTPRSSRSRP